MAESSAATQFPSVSSSSSGVESSAPAGGSCPALGAKSCGSSCADSFVSSSQPVSLFSTSQEELSSLCSDKPPLKIMASSFLSSSEVHNPDLTTVLGEKRKMLGSQPVIAKEGEDPLLLLDMKRTDTSQGTSKDGVGAPFSPAAGVAYSCTSIPTSFPEHPAFLSKEAGPVEQQVIKDQELNLSKVLSREAGSALAVGQSKAEGICGYSLSPSELPGGSTEKDSPESPFEVLIDKAAFDREFKDSYKECTNDLGGWAVHTDGESSADLLESNDKVFPLRSKEAGRYPASTLLTRQFSHTTAALEEVSRCVNDMHNFTNEILTWDLVPQVKQQTKSSDCTTKSTGLERREHHSEIPVINLKMNTHQKMPVCSLNGSTPITKPTGDWPEASLPQENVTGKPVRHYLNSTEETSGRDVQGSAQIQGNVLSELPTAPGGKPIALSSGAATVKVVLPNLKDAVNWSNSALGEATEADSSGESDDTVIEDITADTSFENNKLQPEKPSSIPSAVAKTSERELREIPSCQTLQGEASKHSSGGPRPAQPDTLRRSPDGGEACSQVPGTSSEVAPGKPPTTVNSKLSSAAPPGTFLNETEFSLTMTAFANLEPLHGKHVKDADDSSPEDLPTAFTETPEKGIVEEGEGSVSKAVSETAHFQSTWPVVVLRESESGGSDIKDIKSKHGEHRETDGSELLDTVPSQGTPVASLDLEQEQLTIRALKELGERHTKRGQGKGESERKLKQPFVPQSRSQRSSDFLEHTDVKTGSDLGISKKPTILKETRADSISSLSRTEAVGKRVLASLLTGFSVRDLIFWRDVKKTGVVFGTTLIMLLSLAAFSVISVVSYLILALLSVTISFRVYKSVIQAVQKSEEGHPFKAYLDVDITLSSEAFHNYMNAAMVHVNRALKLIIRLFLVEDLVDSLKLAVFMWLMTYVGAVFNGITLLILAELLIFSVPIVYEKYKTQIDHYVGIARDQTKSIVEKIQAKLPGITKKKAE
ncbi:reticulon-3 isoform X2 [Nannospalax galili]|uniref:reticulon-3 isoform X2 n=1 Tax=Nannospalax galili TaxID=1026970 RepID=UPI0004ED0665|nr:reticulon-3 isoform X2 [Nannospalax galili]